MSQTYRTLKIRIPWKLIEERPDVLDLATRMHLAAEEYVRKLLKELTGQDVMMEIPLWRAVTDSPLADTRR
ncbi:hypothetical protein [Pyrobaculum islandicum]|uniref:hypothetical protein n=1 Tax=Pyrobaculum islandicum TaxID=2277 RepID=UPI0014330E08|nr:hypothetical protein [Pyrobaculum islandicum]